MKTLTKTLCLVSALAVLLLAAPPAPAAEPSQPASGETVAQVPELTAFHKVIYKIWHDAWPKKDAAALAALVPEVESGAAQVEQATLPGILRDRKPAWEAGVAKLKVIVAEYREAASSNDATRLFDAAERLHSQFEALVRTIRPALPEIDAFHQVLYVLYHHLMPAWDPPKIQASVQGLASKMDALNKAVLPERLKAKQADFEAKRSDLDGAVRDLGAAVRSGRDEKAIREAIEAVHTRYRALEGIF